ncbi:MAG: carotenoid 1,2-hydratase [Pseudomonadota bacterium]
MSDDGRQGITVIAFVGSVFSPGYANARRRQPDVDPLDYCALNVVVYERDRKSWALTEWPRHAIHRDADHFALGPNRLSWNQGALELIFDERQSPFGQPLRGRLRLTPEHLYGHPVYLDQAREHRWWPVCPHARIEVWLDQPGLHFVGAGYHDSNEGDVPLEQSFRYWTWSRATLPKGTAVLYDVDPVAGPPTRRGWLFDHDGRVRDIAAPRAQSLPPGLWGVPRHTRVDEGASARVEQTFEDSPFYMRSLLRTRLLGEDALAVHEALSLERFDQTWVQLLLPFRMRRRRRWNP